MKKCFNRARWPLLAAVSLVLFACAPDPRDADYDVIIRGGTLYDGLGGDTVVGDLAITDDRITAQADIKKILGENLLRVWREVEAVAAKM